MADWNSYRRLRSRAMQNAPRDLIDNQEEGKSDQEVIEEKFDLWNINRQLHSREFGDMFVQFLAIFLGLAVGVGVIVYLKLNGQ